MFIDQIELIIQKDDFFTLIIHNRNSSVKLEILSADIFTHVHSSVFIVQDDKEIDIHEEDFSSIKYVSNSEGKSFIFENGELEYEFLI